MKKFIMVFAVCLTVFAFGSCLHAGAQEVSDTDTVGYTDTVRKDNAGYRAKLKSVNKKIGKAQRKFKYRRKKQKRLTERYRILICDFKESQNGSFTSEEISELNGKSAELNLLSEQLKANVVSRRQADERIKKIPEKKRRRLYAAKKNKLRVIRQGNKVLSQINTLLTESIDWILN